MKSINTDEIRAHLEGCGYNKETKELFTATKGADIVVKVRDKNKLGDPAEVQISFYDKKNDRLMIATVSLFDIDIIENALTDSIKD